MFENQCCSPIIYLFRLIIPVKCFEPSCASTSALSNLGHQLVPTAWWLYYISRACTCRGFMSLILWPNEHIKPKHQVKQHIYIYIWCLKTKLWGKVSGNYWLTCSLTFLAGRLAFLLTFSYMCSFCLLSAVCCCCFARCIPAGFYWSLARLSDMLVAAAGSSWLLKPCSAYVRLTFCLRFSYVKQGPYETWRKPLLGQWQCEKHKERHQDPHNSFWIYVPAVLVDCETPLH